MGVLGCFEGDNLISRTLKQLLCCESAMQQDVQMPHAAALIRVQSYVLM